MCRLYLNHVYTLSFSTCKIQGAEAQWSYTFQQKSNSTWLSQRMIQYYRNITLLKIQKNTIHEEIYITKRCSRYSKRASGAKQERNWEEELRRRPSFGCALTTTGGSAAHSDQLQLSHHGPDSKIWTWESRVIRCNPRVHIIKPDGVHNNYTWAIKWCDPSMHVQIITNDIREFKGMTVNHVYRGIWNWKHA